KACVNVYERLNPILTAREIGETLQGMTEHCRVDDRALTGCQSVDIHSEKGHAGFARLVDWRTVAEVACNGDVHASGNRYGMRGGADADLEARLGIGRWRPAQKHGRGEGRSEQPH